MRGPRPPTRVSHRGNRRFEWADPGTDPACSRYRFPNPSRRGARPVSRPLFLALFRAVPALPRPGTVCDWTQVNSYSSGALIHTINHVGIGLGGVIRLRPTRTRSELSLRLGMRPW